MGVGTDVHGITAVRARACVFGHPIILDASPTPFGVAFVERVGAASSRGGSPLRRKNNQPKTFLSWVPYTQNRRQRRTTTIMNAAVVIATTVHDPLSGGTLYCCCCCCIIGKTGPAGKKESRSFCTSYSSTPCLHLTGWFGRNKNAYLYKMHPRYRVKTAPNLYCWAW